MERFDITFYEGPGKDYVVKEEVIADMAASGMTLSQLWFTYDVETNIRALQLLEKYNMKAVLYEKRLLALYNSRKVEDVEEVVKTVVEDYKDWISGSGHEFKSPKLSPGESVLVVVD